MGSGGRDTDTESEEGGEREESQRAREFDSNSLYKFIPTLHKASLCEKTFPPNGNTLCRGTINTNTVTIKTTPTAQIVISRMAGNLNKLKTLQFVSTTLN